MKSTARVAVASALTGTAVQQVHAAENNTIQLALIGCAGLYHWTRPHPSRTQLRSRRSPQPPTLAISGHGSLGINQNPANGYPGNGVRS